MRLFDIKDTSYNTLAGQSMERLWWRATDGDLVPQDVSESTKAAICRRIVIAQSLYAFGALLCVFGTAWSIGFIALVQLNYAVAPRFRGQT